MKNLLKITIIISLCFIRCSSPKNNIPHITYNDSAFIKLTVLNCTDTTDFCYKTVPLLPVGCVIKEIKITHDSVYYFSHKTTKPDFIDLILRNEFQTYVIPGDTLKIVSDLDPKLDYKNAVKLEGVFEEIRNYYSKKHEKLGYWELSDPITSFSNIKKPIEKVFSLCDSLFKNEMDFLNNYQSTYPLPHWFYEIMKTDIEYNKVLIRPYLISYRKFFYKENIIHPEAYYKFDQINLYNPKAKLSVYYYDCIDNYLITRHEEGLEGKHGVDRALPIIARSIPEIKEILKDDILEYYLAHKVSELFSFSRSINDFTRVDSLYKRIQPQFNNKEIIEILNNQRTYLANYFETVRKSPFTYSKIIPADN